MEEDHLGKPYNLRLLRRLFPYARRYRSFFLVSIGLVVAITALDLALPYLTKVAIDRYIVQDIGDKEETASRRQRLYVVDVRRPGVEAVVRRYPSLFEVRDGEACIRYEDLAVLARDDLAALRQGDYAGVTRIALIFMVVVICHFVFSFGHVMVMEYAGQSIMRDFRLRLFKHLLNLSVEFFTRNPVGRLVTRATSDVQNMHEFFTSIITVLFKDIFLVLGITFVLLAMNWRLALICFVMLPFIFLATAYFSAMARDVFRELRVKIAEIATRFQEMIDGIRVVQLFLQEARNYERFKRLNHKNYLAGIRQINIFAVFMPVIELLSSVTTALVIWYGGGKVVTETLSLGALVAFISYMRMFFSPIRDIAEKYNIMQSAMASSERIFLLLDTNETIPEPEEPLQIPGLKPKGNGISATVSPAIPDREKPRAEGRGGFTGPLGIEQGARSWKSVAYENIWFSYVEGTWILRDISLTVPQGKTVAIVGPTGAGKSTLIHLLERFYDPTKGRITIGGVDIRQVQTASLRSRMALITQDVFLFADTIRNNITGGNPAIPEENLREILVASNMQRLVQQLPDGLDTVLTEGGRTLSGGERQLLAFARALAHDPEILILDEATSSVDTETERLIQEATVRLMQGRTAIVVAHRLSTVRHADTIVVLHRGRIRELGSHDELMAKEGLYYQLFKWQRI